jgi:hypothetical protein
LRQHLYSPERSEDTRQIPVLDARPLAPVLHQPLVRQYPGAPRSGDGNGLALPSIKRQRQSTLAEGFLSVGHDEIYAPMLDKFDSDLQDSVSFVHPLM